MNQLVSIQTCFLLNNINEATINSKVDLEEVEDIPTLKILTKIHSQIIVLKRHFVTEILNRKTNLGKSMNRGRMKAIKMEIGIAYTPRRSKGSTVMNLLDLEL